MVVKKRSVTTRSNADSSAAETTTRRKVLTAPVVLKLEKNKKKKKKKYSRGSKASQRLAQGTADALYRAANSLGRASKSLSKRSKKSSRKKKDGLVRDSLRNTSRATGKGLTELGKAPNEIAKRIGTKQVRRAVRMIIPFAR
jgi:hypothetical protein